MDKFNCLVKRLNGGCQDDNLPVFAESYLDIKYNSEVEQSEYGFGIFFSKPTFVRLSSSYFTDSSGNTNLGTRKLHESGNLYIKKPSSGDIRLYIEDKYAVVSVISFYNDVVISNENTFDWSTEMTSIDLRGASNSVDGVALGKRLTKMSYYRVGSSFKEPFIVNELAEAQIVNGRDYQTNPKLNVFTVIGKYYNGTSIVSTLSAKIWIIFKEGGYEIRNNSEDGELMYDSTANT